MNRRQNQRGIALITTLIMLSVVTLMAVAFLAVSRRERSSVTTTTDRIDARAMAEIALQRAESEVVARVQAVSNLLNYDLLVSTNYINPAGFAVGNTNIANVSYLYPNGDPLTGDDLLAMYRNLQVDPRAPVFLETNAVSGAQEHRYFLDFNRNGLFETNGIQVEVDDNGRSLLFTNFHIGDPEWIGVLRRPDQPHSGSNHMVGRFAYLVLPAGKTLDLNFIHNQAKRVGPVADGYFRNQGVGSWEINLAAFFRELNTNCWNGYLYRTNPFAQSSGVAFEDALSLLRYRYRRDIYDFNPSYNRLQSVRQLYRAEGFNAFLRDGNDGYSDGPIQLGIERPYRINGANFAIDENDEPNEPWPGAQNPFQFFDPQELFTVSEAAIGRSDIPSDERFTYRLYTNSIRRSTYNRHTFYRLLGQLGVDSVPADRGRIHLNYDNRLDFNPRLSGARPNSAWGFFATNFVAWTPLTLFTNAADAILKSAYPPGLAGSPLVAITNLSVWPTNLYVPEVHRSLQVAANIADATTNATQTAYPHLPHVYRPIFARQPGGAVVITGYEPVWDGRLFWANSVLPAGNRIDLDEDGATGPVGRNTHVAGIPLIIGAKKGFPNFNEFALQTVVQATRKLELVKRSPQARPTFTNQLYTIGISNLFGLEFFNSYTQAFPRPLELRVRLETDMVLSNDVRVVRRLGPTTLVTNIVYDGSTLARTWQGNEFKLPLTRVVEFLPDSIYRADGTFLSVSNRAQVPFESAAGFPIPTWRLAITNRLQAMLIDTSPGGNGRIIDYVDLDNLNSLIDVTAALFGQEDNAGQTSLVGSFWQTNRVGGIPEGIRNQIQASLGSINVSEWNSASFDPITGLDKDKAVAGFQQFVGLGGSGVPSPTLRMQVPFSPARKLFQNKAWQVNDPLVNDLYWDLEDPSRTNDVRYVKPVRAPIDPDTHNLGQINYRYRPWQANLYSSGDATDYDVAVKDPQISRSDDWDFPTNALPSIGWLGRIHRGTPWQTVYMKAPATSAREWIRWSGHVPLALPGPVGAYHPSTHPTNDWRLPGLFTTAIGESASRGLLSVNQSGRAAWSAILSGIPILTNQFATNIGPMLIEPNTAEVRVIVDGINFTRSTRHGGRFNFLGEILATPELSTFSPYLRLTAGPGGTPADAVVERIPQMALSLLKADEPRFVVYAYGQSLRPAPASVVTDFGPYFQMPTNYVISGEYVTKTLLRLETVQDLDPVTGRTRQRILSVKESYNEVPPTE
ncbi:MAG: hypothetical protein AB7O66_15770 [Limisphaerales bacterium]